MPVPVLLLLTAAGFGASPLMIALSVAHVPPWSLGAFRALAGLPLLALAALLLGQRRPAGPDLVTALVGGVLVIAVPFVTMAAGLRHIPSGLGGMLYATMPLFTLGLAAAFLRDEPASRAQVLRIGLGLVGVALIAAPALTGPDAARMGWGTALTLVSPLSYAAGNVWFRRRPPVAPLALTASMFAVGGALMLPLALVIEGPPPALPGPEVAALLAAMVLFTTVAPAILNYVLVQRAGANRASLAMFLLPGFAVLFGWLFRAEDLPLTSFLGLAVVIAVSLPGRR